MGRPAPRKLRIPKPANDNESPKAQINVEIRIPQDLPITQVEVEVFAQLLDDWLAIPANDNEEA